MTDRQSIKVGVVGSGKGSNFVAIAEAASRNEIPADVVLVLSDVPDAGILNHARKRGIEARYIPPGKFRTRLDEASEELYIQALRQAGVELVVLAGFMRIIKGAFLRAFPRRILNIHPSLLPAFPGLQAWRQAWEHGVKFTGCTVHFVDEGMDTGPIIGQRVVPVMSGDTPESLHERIQVAERELYPAVVARIAFGTIACEGRRTFDPTQRA
ncbi:MAG TPA: phosphoribosylglycinamide formyltransferase [Candidatus Paceibacterota bacterium]|nr:phosphoribosylglycinamide formyltransferase [Verrucomicrobiota bacterium]HRY47758.1 phosphoribosylglycinamide formyltransferase [Candidatus Paceibacterota bacterium]